MANTHSLDFDSGITNYMFRLDTALSSGFPGKNVGGHTGDFTIEAWVKPETTTGTMDISKKRNIVGSDNGWNFFISTDNRVRMAYYDAGATSSANTNGAVVTDGVWTHVACTVDVSSATFTFYVDGASVAHTVTNSAATAIGVNVGLFDVSSDTDPFNGKIDDFRIWSDIRTSGEISANYNKELTGSEANLEGYYKFNNDLLDSTSNGNDLTNNGATDFDLDPAFSSRRVFTVS